MKIDLLRGFFGIGIYMPKYEENIGTLWRHAYLYNASFIFTIGRKYREQASDTTKAYRNIPMYYYETYEEFRRNIPEGCEIIEIEIAPDSIALSTYKHPERAIYLLGSEGSGLPRSVMDDADAIVQIYTPKSQSMNVAVTGTLVMYDRTMKSKND